MAEDERRHASRRSVQWRLTFIATGIVGLVMCLGLLVLFGVMHRQIMGELRERGTVAVRQVADTARRGPPPPEMVSRVFGFFMLQIADDQGRVIASSPALRGRPLVDDVRPGREGRPVRRVVHVPGQSTPLYVVAERVNTPDGPRIALAAASMREVEQFRRVFSLVAGAMLPLVLGLVGWTVWVSVGHALRPFALMRRELAQITGGCMGRRVTVPDTDDEVADLARSVNITLERLQRFVEAQRGFVADVSHELRSPLTGLRAQLEVALAHPDDEDWPAVARAALADADRLQRIVTDVLMLARLDAGVRSERGPVDLGELARAEATDRPRKVPVHVHVHDVARPLIVYASRTQLVRVLTNLLDNAERHASSEIRISVYRDGEEAVLEVADDGSGIPLKDRDRVFQRFQRLPESRQRDAHGSGLGLPIARDIVNAHGGTLVIGDSEQGGALLVLRLPLKETGRSES
ncbi:Signal transduction histidine kinase [Thermomonospora echinospora]|uniref:histidine kinase n=1 Tax=Thermomonospora echinospora TaxID=1992 RepID=A0A1H6B3T7_9ACTN|nr:HAMP domain-containing sensor histidine kinase [Thermomonospora echinospora]SEG55260.1 Signal transduction histidine kinase [Thermomonospora echinospora]